MTQASLLPRDEIAQPVPQRKKSRTEQVADYFKARPYRWIDGLVFAEFAGQYAWRSRIADARTVFGMRITNKQRRRADGSIKSLYRFEPGLPWRRPSDKWFVPSQ